MLNNYFITRRGVNDLHSLTDKELNDIGLNRGDVYELEKNNSFIKSLFNEIKHHIGYKSKKEYIEEYLGSSVDRIDLELREKELARKGYLPW